MMKSLLLILCCSLALHVSAQKARALRVNEIPESEAVADTFHIGMTCTYKLTGSKAAAFAFASRDNSALIRINGRDCWLKFVPAKTSSPGKGPAFSLQYKNTRYKVVLQMRRLKDDDGNKGTMTVTDLKSYQKASVAIEGGCEA